MTLAEHSHMIGRTGILLNALRDDTRDTSGLDVAVVIVDVRNMFGRVDVKVTPVAGSGHSWVDVNRVSFEGGR